MADEYFGYQLGSRATIQSAILTRLMRSNEDVYRGNSESFHQIFSNESDVPGDEEIDKEPPRKVRPSQCREEMLTREIRVNQLLENIEKKTENDKLMEIQVKAEGLLKFREKYFKGIEQMKEKRGNRREKMRELKETEETYQFLKQKPLFQQMKEKFQNTLDIQLETEKAEIEKQRKFNQSFNQSGITDHVKWYDTLKPKQVNRTAISSTQTKSLLGNKLFKEALVHKQQLVEKSKEYSSIVKTKYLPKIKTHNNNTVKQEIYSNNDNVKRIKWQPKKYPNNPLVPLQKQMKEPKSIDYLAERRATQGRLQTHPRLSVQIDDSLPKHMKIKQLRHVSELIDKEIRKREIQLQSSTSFSFKKYRELLKRPEELLLSSIKAKLSLVTNY